MNRIEFDSISLTYYRFFSSYRETTCCVLSNVNFPIGIMQIWLQIIEVLELFSLCFGGFASSLSWHLAYRARVEKFGLRDRHYFVSGATAGVRCGIICVTEEQ